MRNLSDIFVAGEGIVREDAATEAEIALLSSTQVLAHTKAILAMSRPQAENVPAPGNVRMMRTLRSRVRSG